MHKARSAAQTPINQQIKMQKRVTITLDEVVYDGLMRVAGRGTVSRFLAALARPHVLDTAMDAGCSAMGNDLEREAEASEWINGLIGDRSSAARCGVVWWVEFDPAVGSKIWKIRPDVIVSNNSVNRN